MNAMCREVLVGGGDGADAKKPPYQVSIVRCDQCDRTWQDSAGRSIEVSPAIGEMAECDGEILGHVDGETPEKVTLTIPAAVRRMVLARDHHRCTVPGCSSTRGLEVHHIEFRCHGGNHDPRNLATLCCAHHKARHDGQLLITGSAPHALVFTHADGRPYGSTLVEVQELRPQACPTADRAATRRADR